jgi:hypothetical protein
MRDRLPILNIYFIGFSYAWLHLIQWRFPVMEYTYFFSDSVYATTPAWALTYNQLFAATLTVICTAVMLRLKLIRYLLFIMLGMMAFIALADFMRRFPNLHELMEHGVRIATPILLLLILLKKTDSLSNVVKAGIAATFIGHGIYALGIPSIPENFIEMTVNITGWNVENAEHFLFVVGILDILAGVGLFFNKSVRMALWYCIIWGLLTAFARILAHWHLPAEEIFFRWLPEMLLRLPNSLLPLWTLWTFYPNSTDYNK